MKKYDVIIIGAGPAGISSALYAKRAGLSILVFDNGLSKLESAKEIANYYGTGTISGKKLKENGVLQAKALDIDVINKSVDYIEKDYENNEFVLKDDKETYVSKAVVLATGFAKNTLDKRLEKFKNQNISSCAICDGYFYKDKTVGVLGNSTYALSEAKILSLTSKQVYVLTESKTNFQNFDNIKIIDKKIEKFEGKTKIENIVFKDGSFLPVDGIFVAEGEMDAGDIAKKLGLVLKDNAVLVNEKCETNLKGLYAAGDVTGGLCQVAKAVYQGMVAGLEIVNYIKK